MIIIQKDTRGFGHVQAISRRIKAERKPGQLLIYIESRKIIEGSVAGT